MQLMLATDATGDCWIYPVYTAHTSQQCEAHCTCTKSARLLHLWARELVEDVPNSLDPLRLPHDGSDEEPLPVGSAVPTRLW